MYFNLLQFFVFLEFIRYHQAYWIRDLSYCPRKRESIRQRQCFKSCFDDSDCRSRYRSCVCDYDCGMSCVKRGITCPFLTPPEHGQISYSNENKFGSRATYECEQGFILEGPKHRHCQGDMWWGPSDSIPYCTKEVFCNRPTDIINAVNDIPSTITSFHAGYSVKYTCLTGYVGNGTTTSECTFLGQWTFATLKCTPIDCGSPGMLRNGFLSGERFDYPNIIAFFCNDGYELIGKDTTRACQENGLWSGTMPTCQSVVVEKSCGSPPFVLHSEIIQPDRTSNTTIQYICQHGYRLVGSAVLKCVMSQWQPTPPICLNLEITCTDPQLTFNSHIESSSKIYPVDSVVKFHCPSNLTLRGARLSKCHINGSWIPKLPQCEFIDSDVPIELIACSIPLLPPNGRYLNEDVLDGQMADGSQLKYICGNVQRHRRIICRKGRIFPRLPHCFRGKINRHLGCHVHNERMATFSKTFYRHREKVHFTCPLLNNQTIYCMNGTLSEEPICQESPPMCTVPHTLFLRNILNTTIPSGTSLAIGSSFSYQCIQDYQPANDSGIVRCLENGQFSHHAHCVPISCKEHPPTIEHGRPILRSIAHGSIVRYRCYPGYRLDNNHPTKLTCQFGLWLPKQPPKCLPIFCPNPGPLMNGQIYVVIKDQRLSSTSIRKEFRSYIPTVIHGRTIEFECDSGYVLHGPTGLTCHHGQWIPTEKPRCIIG